jgi:hypothetical protein
MSPATPTASSKVPIAKQKLQSPTKLEAPIPALPSSSTPTKPQQAMLKSKVNVLEQNSPNTQLLTSKLDAMSLNNPSPMSSPTKRVYHAAKENRDTPKISVFPAEEEEGQRGMSEQAKKSLRSINALRGLTLDEIEVINKPQVKRLATVTQLCTLPLLDAIITFGCYASLSVLMLTGIQISLITISSC